MKKGIAKYIFYFAMIQILLFVLAAHITYAQTSLIDPTFYISPRVYGMGGAYTAVALGAESMFYNPAGYSLPGNKSLSFLDITILANSDFLSLAEQTNWFSSFESQLTDPAFVANLLKLKLGFGISGLPFIGLISDGFAVGLFQTNDIKAVFSPTVLIPDITIKSNTDIGLIMGYSISILDFIYVGVNAKLLSRIWVDSVPMSLTTFLDAINNGGGSLPFDVNYGFGVGFDVGGIIKLDKLQLGLMLKNVGGLLLKYETTNDISQIFAKAGTKDAYIPMEINIGASYNFGSVIPFIMEDVIVAADIQRFNLFIDDVSKYSNITLLGKYFYIGAQVKTLEMLTLRLGLYQGYITCGIGINFVFMKINFTYYSEELGTFIGTIPQHNLLLNISFMY